MAQANPLAGLAAINGVLDAVKRTAGGVKNAKDPTAGKATKPKISLPGASKIEPGMNRESVLALVGQPTQTVRLSRSGESLRQRDVYLVKRQGSCAVDQVDVTYESAQGAILDIRQVCGDVTSNEDRCVSYSFTRELPPIFDNVHLGMPRHQVIEMLGSPMDTRSGQTNLEFIDVHVIAGEEVLFSYKKGDKLLLSVRWKSADVRVPRIQRADIFESGESK